MDARIEITPDDLKTMRAAGEDFFLVDVRERDEYEEGRIPGALSIPMHELEEKLKGIRKDRALILYCHVGVRSKEVCIALTRAGWTNVKTVRGGYEAWQEQK